jgi:methylated-DNA-[protein]-cysteine S-methyltransferase
MSADSWDAIVDAHGFALGIALSGEVLARIEFLPSQAARAPRSSLAREVAAQLNAYMKDPLSRFDLPLASTGSAHQQTVWRVMCTIEPGLTLSYGELAKRIGSSPRAVGGACGANPFPVVVPCHRVIAAGGALGGFAHSTQGFLPGIKRWLLAHEAAGCGFSLSASGPARSSRRPDARPS